MSILSTIPNSCHYFPSLFKDSEYCFAHISGLTKRSSPQIILRSKFLLLNGRHQSSLFASARPSRCVWKLHLKLINTLQFWSISTIIDIPRSFTKETIANLHYIYWLLTCCSFDEIHFSADRISSSTFKGIFRSCENLSSQDLIS